MTDWAGQIVTRLAANSGVTALVGTYGGGPSILIETDTAPSVMKADAHGPFILLPEAPNTQSEIAQVLGQAGMVGTWRLTFPLRVYGMPDQPVTDLAHAVARALGGWRQGVVLGCETSYPVEAPASSPAVIGRLVNVTLTVEDT